MNTVLLSLVSTDAKTISTCSVSFCKRWAQSSSLSPARRSRKTLTSWPLSKTVAESQHELQEVGSGSGVGRWLPAGFVRPGELAPGAEERRRRGLLVVVDRGGIVAGLAQRRGHPEGIRRVAWVA